MRICLLTCTSVIAIGFSMTGAQAQETTTYQYDALGRLVSSQISGGPNNSITTSTNFDAAGNRNAYTVANAPTPTPTPSCSIQIMDRSVTLIKYSQPYSYSVNPIYSPNCSSSIVLSYSTHDGSAVSPNNYVATSGTVTVQPGQVNVPITLNSLQIGGEDYLVFYIDFAVVSGFATLDKSRSKIELAAD